MKRSLRGILIASLLAAAAVSWLLCGSLPQLDGEVALPGLSAPVSLARDRLGVVSIDAANELDAMRALGYVHGQERFFEMDLMRRTAAGELAALFGQIAVDTDKRHRVHRFRARVEGNLPRIAGDKLPVLQAYAEGVNAGLRDLRTRPWPYLLLRRQPRPWRLHDTPLVGYAMYFDLQDSTNARELALLRMRPHLPEALFDLLLHDGSSWDAPLIGEERGDAVLPGAAAVDLSKLPTPARPATALRAAGEVGSNSFAVAGSLTGDGRAILANDMHLGLRAPNIWFRARLRYADPRAPGGRVDVSGVTLPGLPAVVVGSNGHVAWGFTNSYVDTQQWRREPACRSKASCAGTEHHERIEVAGADPVTLVVHETSHGPLLHRLPDGSRMALRWEAHRADALNIAIANMAHAGDIDAALSIATTAALPHQNLLLADRGGRIAWALVGPRKMASAGALPNPRIAASRPARLWTANNRVLDGAALQQAGDGGYALGARAKQIRDALHAKPRFTEADLLAIQLDDRALFLQRWWQLLQEQARLSPSPALRELAVAGQQRPRRASADSVSYRLVRAWRLAVHARLLDGLTAPAQVALGKDYIAPQLRQFEGVAWPLVTQRPPHLLPRRYPTWHALFEDAAVEVRDGLAAHGPVGQRKWGERNTAAICHPLTGAIPLIGKRLLCMPADPLPGDSAMPRVQSPGFGASQRMVVAPGHEAQGYLHMPGGQSGHPLSPFWGAGHDDWVRGRPTAFLPGKAQHTLRIIPSP